MVAQWKIYLVVLDPAQGSEQAGRRPVLIISADVVNVLNTVTVLPLTSLKSPNRKIRANEVLLAKQVTGLDRASIALGHQIRTVDKLRLESVAGEIKDEQTRHLVREAVKVQLAL